MRSRKSKKRQTVSGRLRAALANARRALASARAARKRAEARSRVERATRRAAERKFRDREARRLERERARIGFPKRRPILIRKRIKTRPRPLPSTERTRLLRQLGSKVFARPIDAYSRRQAIIDLGLRNLRQGKPLTPAQRRELTIVFRVSKARRLTPQSRAVLNEWYVREKRLAFRQLARNPILEEFYERYYSFRGIEEAKPLADQKHVYIYYEFTNEKGKKVYYKFHSLITFLRFANRPQYKQARAENIKKGRFVYKLTDDKGKPTGRALLIMNPEAFTGGEDETDKRPHRGRRR